MTTTVRRLARTPHPCGWGTCRTIAAGEVYLVHTAYPGPGDDAGYATSAGHPVRIAECVDCATRYGRAELLEAPEQVAAARARLAAELAEAAAAWEARRHLDQLRRLDSPDRVTTPPDPASSCSYALPMGET